MRSERLGGRAAGGRFCRPDARGEAAASAKLAPPGRKGSRGMALRNRDAARLASAAAVWNEVLCGDGSTDPPRLTVRQRVQLAMPLVAVVCITIGLVIRFIMVETFPDDD